MEIPLPHTIKKNITKSILSIFLFIIVYLLLLTFSIGLVLLCVIGGLKLILLKLSIYTILIALAIVALAIFILIFLVKFFFKEHKIDKNGLKEITREDSPLLFQMIDDIVNQVGTKSPKKVYLSHDVNASVFYDSSFWSMFFPVKKNLQIGLGLVNVMNEQELKAILAHEFGHFSQRSMAVGSYVYNCNEIIYNMLYDNENFSDLIERWSNIASILALSATLAIKVIQGIQWILRKIYNLININYLALSRDMEFHADGVAAYVVGSQTMENALLRLELAAYAYNSVLEFYGEKINDNIKSPNIYKEHSFVLNYMAEQNNIPLKNELPHVTLADLNKYKRSKLNIKDQWSSHPTMEERVYSLREISYKTDSKDTTFANNLFPNINELQKILTHELFLNVEYKKIPSTFELEEFKNEYLYNSNKYNVDAIYNGYYDNKVIPELEVEKIIYSNEKYSFEELFNDNKIALINEQLTLENDSTILQEIANKIIKIKSFDYDGIRYPRKKAKVLLEKITNEIGLVKSQISKNDERIFIYFYNCAKNQNKENELIAKYNEYIFADKEYHRRYDFYVELLNFLNFVSQTLPYEQIESNFREFVNQEIKLKSEIKLFLKMDILNTEIDKSTREELEKYISQEWEYFHEVTYLDTNLNMLFNAIHTYQYLSTRIPLLHHKIVLDFQAEIYKRAINE